MSLLNIGFLEQPFLDAPFSFASGSGIESLAFQSFVTINGALARAPLQSLVTINQKKSSALQASLTITQTQSRAFQSRVTANGSQQSALQSRVTINQTQSRALQSRVTINQTQSRALQASLTITQTRSSALQSRVTINQRQSRALQSLVTVNGPLKRAGFQSSIDRLDGRRYGFQSKIFLENGVKNVGFTAGISRHPHYVCNYFLSSGGFLTEQFLVACNQVPVGFQAILTGTTTAKRAVQSNVVISKTNRAAFQAKPVITKTDRKAFQSLVRQTRQPLMGFQAKPIITNTKRVGAQAHVQISKVIRQSFQAQILGFFTKPFQARVVVYNTTNVRILSNFVSRGNGSSWTSNSTAPGDFIANNLNTDIVEQIWRSAPGVTSNIELICDTNVSQGVFVDTLAILNHNFSGSASVFFDGSNSASFATVDSVTVPLERTKNAYYIAPTLPLSSYRYWRLRITDTGNANGFVSMGTVVFGSAVIFAGEGFTDVVKFGRKQYTDQVFTEGFTNVKNDRGQKNNLSLDFKSLNFKRANYRNLREIIEVQSTVLKSLWIPTPQYPSRFAVFGRLSEMPSESHNDRGSDHDYIDINIAVDEAE